MSLTAIGDYIVIKEISDEKKTESGIVYVTKEDKGTTKGVVTSTSVEEIPVGKIVVVDSYKTAKVTHNNEHYLIVCKDYVLAFAE